MTFLLDDYNTAKKKIKLAEVTSDLQSECDDQIPTKRLCKPSQKYISSSDEETALREERIIKTNKKLLPRPPRISYDSQVQVLPESSKYDFQHISFIILFKKGRKV